MTALVFSLPWVITISLTILTDIADHVGLIDLQVEGHVASPWDGWLFLLKMSNLCSFFPALLGDVLAVTGFALRRTRLAAITLAVAAAPWFLFALLYVVAYLFFPDALV